MKRFLSLILTLCMLCTLLPAYPAQAAEVDETPLDSFAIAELGVNGSGTVVTAKLTATEDCTLVTALYERSGEMFSVSTTPVTGQSAEQTLTAAAAPGERTRYTVKAFLTDSESSEPLCENAMAYYADWMKFSSLRAVDADTVTYDESADIYFRGDILNIFFEMGTSVYDIDDAIESVGGEVVGRVPLLDLLQVRVEEATLSKLRSLSAALMQEYDFVRYCVYDKLVPNLFCSASPVVPDDPWGTLLGDDSDWTDDDIDSNNWWIEYVKGQYAWDYSEEFGEITVGIVDGSFDIGHEDLKNVASFATPELAAANDSTPWWDGWKPTEDHAWNFDQQLKDQRNAHGTHVAGIIGAEANNGKGITGLAWSADLMFAPLSSNSITEALAHITTLVEQGAKVINVSFGSSEDMPPDVTECSEESILECATETAVSLASLIDRDYDFVLVQSAGNGNKNNTLPVDAINNNLIASITPSTPTHSATTTAQDVLDRCLIVTAVDETDTLLRYANYGSQVDIAAPGANVYSTLPGEILTDAEITGGYDTMSGTSMAAPVVTAVCAMVWATCEWLSPEDVCNIVTTSTTKTAYPHHDSGDLTTYPIVDAQLAVETASQYNNGKIPLEINVQYADGTPARNVTIDGTGLGTAPVTDDYGTVLCYVAPDRYLITANPEGWYDEQDVTVKRKTIVNLTLEETWFEWSLDETGKHLTVVGYGPMPDYTSSTIPWGTAISSATVNGVSDIGDLAFYACKSLTEVRLGDSVRKIGTQSFGHTSALKSIALPSRLFKIGSYAFSQSGLTSLSVPGYVHTIGESAFGICSSLTSLSLGNGIVRIGEEAFTTCQSLQSVHIPSSVVEIGAQAFAYLSNATSITLAGGNLKTIGESAFGGCYKITSFTIPDDVTEIPAGMFSYCPMLKNVSIPEGVTSIGGGAFSQCYALKTLKLPSTLTELGSGVFYQCKTLESIAIPDGVTKIEYDTFKECPALKSVTLPKNLTEIGDDAFYECTVLASITFPESLTKIGENAFRKCTSLKSLTIPAKTEVGNCFAECTGLETVTFMPGSYAVYSRAFDRCTNLKTVNLPDSFAGIDTYAFVDCTSLASIRLPASIMYIGEHAFANTALITATFAGSSTDWAKVYNFDETLKAASITFLG